MNVLDQLERFNAWQVELGFEPRPYEPTVVYRFFDRAGVLLYIGVTTNLPQRLKTHKAEKEWWPEVYTLTTEPYPLKYMGYRAEQAAIEAEHPRHNVPMADARRHMSEAKKVQWARRKAAEHGAERTAERIASWSLVYFDDDEAVA